jgi:hypothetical protein
MVNTDLTSTAADFTGYQQTLPSTISLQSVATAQSGGQTETQWLTDTLPLVIAALQRLPDFPSSPTLSYSFISFQLFSLQYLIWGAVMPWIVDIATSLSFLDMHFEWSDVWNYDKMVSVTYRAISMMCQLIPGLTNGKPE